MIGGKKYPCVTNKKTGKPHLTKKGKCLRSFKVDTVNGKKETGRFLSATPAQAASKAFSSWCRKHNKGSRCSTTLRITETTLHGKGKTYGYNASRSWNKTKVPVSGGKTLNFRFSNKLHSQHPRKSKKAHKGKGGRKLTLRKR